jgi:L-fucose mutarotase/ribose pyranase (RbsD/FucU family)
MYSNEVRLRIVLAAIELFLKTEAILNKAVIMLAAVRSDSENPDVGTRYAHVWQRLADPRDERHQ